MLPQPFVTTALAKAKQEGKELRVALDLTAEWDALQAGKEEPSAMITGVVIAQKAFIEAHPDQLAAFLAAYRDSVDFVQNNVDAAAELVAGLGIVPSAAVASQALPACNIVLIEGEEMQQKLSGYLSELFAQNPAAVGGALPAEDFYYIAK
jgi:NitT/TauT family transport system substrate-binding protein